MISPHFIFFILFLEAFSPINLPNYDYLEKGYNPLRGNPSPSNLIFDPGLTVASIFDFSFNEHKRSSDGFYEIPDNLDIVLGQACSYSGDVFSYFSEIDFFNSLSSSVHFESLYEGLFAKGAFSMSSDYKRVSLDIEQNYQVFFVTKAVCTVYTASLQKYSGIKLTKNFLSAILELLEKDQNDKQSFFKFYNEFGTNYFTKAVFGAKTLIESRFSREIYDSLMSESFPFSSAAKASFNSFTGSSSIMTANDFILANIYNSNRKAVIQISIGSSPSTDGKWLTWASLVNRSPIPIEYNLEFIYELVDKKFIPGVDENLLIKLREKMKAYLQDYCFYISGSRCFGPKNQLSFPKYSIISNEGKSLSLTCPTNFSITGVGFIRQENDDFEKLQSFYFINNYQGYCFNYI